MKKNFAPLCAPALSYRFAEAKRGALKLSGPSAIVLALWAIAYWFISIDYSRFGFPKHSILMLMWITLVSFLVGISTIFLSFFCFAEPDTDDDNADAEQ